MEGGVIQLPMVIQLPCWDFVKEEEYLAGGDEVDDVEEVCSGYHGQGATATAEQGSCW